MIFSVASFGVSQSKQYFDWLMENHHQLGANDLKSLFDLEFTRTETFKELDSGSLGKYMSAALKYALENLIEVHGGKKRPHEMFGFDSDNLNGNHANLFMRALAQHKSFTSEHADACFDFFKSYYSRTTIGSRNLKSDSSGQGYKNLSSEFIEFILAKHFTQGQVIELFQNIFLKLKDECLATKKYEQLNQYALPSVIIGFSKLLRNTAGAFVICNGSFDSLNEFVNSSVRQLEQPECASHNPIRSHLHYHLQNVQATLNDDRCLLSIVQTVHSEHRQISDGYKLEHLFHKKNVNELNEIADELCTLDKYEQIDNATLSIIHRLIRSTKLTEEEIEVLVSKFNSSPIDAREAFYSSIIRKKELSDDFKLRFLIDAIDKGHITQMPYKFGKHAGLSFDLIYGILKYLHLKIFRLGDNLQSNIGRFIMEMQPTSNENYIKLFNKVDALCNHDDFFVMPGKNRDYLRQQAASRIVTDVYYPSLLSEYVCQENISMNVLGYCFSLITSADCKLIGSKNLSDLMLQCDTLEPGCINGYYSETAELITSYILNEKVGAIDVEGVTLKSRPRNSV